MLAPTTGEDNYHTTKQNKIKYDKKEHASLTKLKNTYNIKQSTEKKLKPGLVASYNIRPRNRVGVFWQNGRDGKARK